MFKIPIKTTQNIPLFFTPASLGQRFGAYLIDSLIKYGYLLLLFYIVSKTISLEILFEDRWAFSAIVGLVMLPFSFYELVCESLMNGQTFGKKVLRTRVISIQGYQASFYDYFIRWFLGILEVVMLPAIALFSIICTKYSQRLGDLISGTAVISLTNKTGISHTILVEVEQNYTPYFSQSQILNFSDADVQIIKNYYNESIYKRNWSAIGRLCKKIEDISLKTNTLTPHEYVDTFIKDYNYYTGK